jgi:hypothetical protein
MSRPTTIGSGFAFRIDNAQFRCFVLAAQSGFPSNHSLLACAIHEVK